MLRPAELASISAKILSNNVANSKTIVRKTANDVPNGIRNVAKRRFGERKAAIRSGMSAEENPAALTMTAAIQAIGVVIRPAAVRFGPRHAASQTVISFPPTSKLLRLDASEFRG